MDEKLIKRKWWQVKAPSKEEKIKKSLHYSILDGTFYSMMVGFGESFFAAFAALFTQSSVLLGLVGSVPQAIGALFQLFSEKLIAFFGSRRKVMVIGATVQALLFLPIAFLYYTGNFKLYLLLFFICLYYAIDRVLGPAWTSMMGDLVPADKRGRYFGRRNQITGIAWFITMILAGMILKRFADGGLAEIGFMIIFLISLFARLVSMTYLWRMYDLAYESHQKHPLSFFEFVKESRHHNYGLGNYSMFAFYLASVNFAVFVAGPFFTPFMLYDLRMDYLTFTIVNAVSIIAKYLSMPLWGKVSDKYGTKKVLTLSGFLIPFVPFLWFFGSSTPYLIIIQIFNGFVWAGFDLAAFNFLFDTVNPQYRAAASAYTNVLNGIAILIGGVIGIVLVKNNNIFWSVYLLVFLVSFIIRVIAAAYFLPRLKEVRSVDHISYKDLLFHIVTVAPITLFEQTILTFKRHAHLPNLKQEQPTFINEKKPKNPSL